MAASEDLRGNGSLGIRREDKSRWERRAPLAPQHVRELVARGLQVYIQPSNLRVFSDDEYRDAGAVVTEDLSEARTIVAEVPADKLLPNRTYMFFSHTIKAQPSNMGMLDAILAKHIRLIDYEKIVDASGARLVRFGKFAGYAGMIDMLRILGERLLSLGFSTPFLNIGYAHMYPRLEEAKRAVAAVGAEIRRVGLPRALSPMVFAFTGSSGNVGQGAIEIFKLLPFVTLEPDRLREFASRSGLKFSGSWGSLSEAATLAEEEDQRRRTLFAVFLNAKDYVVPNRSDDKFDKDAFYAHPENFHSIFHEKIAPYMSMLVNCAYWDQKYPRILTTAQMRDLVRAKRSRLVAVAELACDVNGAVEFMHKTTSIDRPTFLYDVETGAVHDGFEGRGIVVLAVDNLPTELPREASLYFGDSLLPFLAAVVRSDGRLPVDKQADLPREIAGAVITAHGALAPSFQYVNTLRQHYEAGLHRVLILGSGYVSAPVVDYLMRNSCNKLTVASALLQQARELAKDHTPSNISAIHLDVQDADALDRLVARHELVVSLVPPAFHPAVAKACILHRRNMITASYVSPEMRALAESAKQAGVLILNEIGLDPGIDHMSTLRLLAEIKAGGGKVLSYRSVCGGLPAPDVADNPLGYKFSWHPRGVLTATLKPARYRKDGRVVDVPGPDLLSNAESIEIEPCFSFEVLPNRDAVAYADSYGIADVPTMFRGTLRYKGFSVVMDALSRLGLMGEAQQPYLQPGAPSLTWHAVLSMLVPRPPNVDLRTAIVCQLHLDGAEKRGRANRVTAALEWLGLLDDGPQRPDGAEPQTVPQKGTLLDSLCALLEERLTYERNERDMVVLHHTVEIEWANRARETRTSTMIAFGEPDGYSAMAQTVGLPVAIAAQLLLDKKLPGVGVQAPFAPKLYGPILEQLKEEGVRFVESSRNS